MQGRHGWLNLLYTGANILFASGDYMLSGQHWHHQSQQAWDSSPHPKALLKHRACFKCGTTVWSHPQVLQRGFQLEDAAEAEEVIHEAFLGLLS